MASTPDPYVGSVALAADGGLAVGSEQNRRGWVQVREPGAGWVSTVMGPMYDAPLVAYDGRGTLLAVAWRGTRQKRALVRRERDAGGRWSAASVITTVREEQSGHDDPALVVDYHGRALVTWAISGVQYAATGHVSGDWSGPVRLGSATTSPAYRENVGYQAAVGFAGDGTGWVAWEGANGRVSVARSAGGARRFARPVSVGVRGSHRPVLATRADGGAVVAWVGRPTVDDTFDSDRAVEAAPVFAAVLSPSGVARRPTRLSNRSTGASEPFVAAAPTGETTVVWQPDEGKSARYATAGRNGEFGRARMLAGLRVDFGFAGVPPLAMRSDGTALLLARGREGTKVYARRAASFGPLFAPPALHDDTYAEAQGAGLAVAGKLTLAVWQKPSGADTIDPSGEALLVVTPSGVATAAG